MGSWLSSRRWRHLLVRSCSLLSKCGTTDVSFFSQLEAQRLSGWMETKEGMELRFHVWPRSPQPSAPLVLLATCSFFALPESRKLGVQR